MRYLRLLLSHILSGRIVTMVPHPAKIQGALVQIIDLCKNRNDLKKNFVIVPLFLRRLFCFSQCQNIMHHFSMIGGCGSKHNNSFIAIIFLSFSFKIRRNSFIKSNQLSVHKKHVMLRCKIILSEYSTSLYKWQNPQT